ncbi:phosphoribosylanthranilate isomerase [Calothrix sp. PCC 6303]|uniref:phosphoribosylanthranilate isomerase n=1 Tax=Calothrix sp. PCC 6303 TaxID=1170562 RepID=UPI00030CE9BA|nr:phosphoribosylanthranilate isomerase [Calothrix sp. PCC 6303]
MRIKICGIKYRDQGKFIVDIGATALGFICVPQSPRFVNAEQIKLVTEVIPKHIDKIGVFANSCVENIRNVVINSDLTGIQLHGDESVDFCISLRESLPGIEVIKALRIREIGDLEKVAIYKDYVDYLLLDAYDGQQLGGTGKTIDWQILKYLEPGILWFLAGGLRPNNIVKALIELKPSGIDLSSGVESSPGNKDLEKVTQLFEQLSQVNISK